MQPAGPVKRPESKKSGGKQPGNRGQCCEDVATAEMERQRLPAPVDHARVHPRFQEVSAARVTECVDELKSHVVARRRRKSLSADAGNAGDFESGPALIFLIAGSVASRVEGTHVLGSACHEQPRLVHEVLAHDQRMGRTDHHIVVAQCRGPAPRDKTTERFDVFVQFGRTIDSEREALARAEMS